jgi:uncharacterized protein (DUF302 family)
MKNEITEKLVNKPFETVYIQLKENILAEGFLILHEIDTQSIVSKHGIIIKPLKQILFFHPNYIQKIVAEDYLAINEIPIKLVVMEIDENKISVSVPNPKERLSSYTTEGLGEELLKRLNQILDLETNEIK